MNQMKHFLLTIFLFSFIFSDAIEVSPSSLDYGNVLMGNTPTLSFTITSDLEQTITLQIPPYFEADVESLILPVGESQQLNVTFSPPSVGTYDTAIYITGSTFGGSEVSLLAEAVNDIAGSLNGTITAEYSPYEISGDIWVDEGNTLTINPGVTFEFSGSYGFDIYGTLISVGEPENLIYFKSLNEDEISWEGIFFKDNDNESIIQFTMIEHAGIQERHIDGFEEADEWNGSYTQYESYYTSQGHHNRVSDESFSGNYSLKIGSGQQGTDTIAYFEHEVIAPPGGCTITFQHKGVQDDDVGEWFYIYAYNIDGEYNNTIFQYNPGTYDWTVGQGSLSEGRNIIHLSFGGYNGRYRYIDDVSFQGCIIESISGQGLEIDNSDVQLTNSYITNNTGYGLSIKNSDLDIEHCILHGNFLADGSNTPGLMIKDNYTDILLVNTIIDVINGSSSLTLTEFNNYYGNPIFTDQLGHLDPIYSPCIDAGTYNTADACMPPGLGTSATDIGMYGGWNNCGLTESNIGCMDSNASNYNPDATYDNDSCDYTNELASPIIDAVVDIPQDQGGYVGIQYQGSIYDYSQFGYDITRYSFWRELDVTPENASTIPNGEYYITNRDEYWEWVGEMPSQQFETYGYTTETLANSNDETGVFISTFLVVAHTEDDGVFFTSNPASGSSVDNLAPTTPDGLFGQYQDMAVNLAWNETEDPDVLYYEVFKDNELIGVSENNTFSDDNVLVAPIYYYLLAYDENYNISESSDVLMYTSDVSGDITQNFQVNVLDIIVLVDIILGNYNGNTEVPEYVLTSSDLNEDNEVNILDIVILANSILDIPLN